MLPLRIVVVGPVTGGSLSVAECAVRALRRLGHEVTYVDNTRHWPVLAALRASGEPEPIKGRMLGAFLDQVRAESRRAAAAARPQVALHLAQAPVMRDEDLEDLRRAGVPTILWFVEDAGVFTGWREMVGRFDHFWTIQQGFATELERLGQRFADEVPAACDPELHRPRAGVAPRWDVTFVGSAYPNRVRLLRALADLPGLRLFGPGWAADPVLRSRVEVDGALAHGELGEVFAASRINLNLSSAVDPAAFGRAKSFANPRTFEICGSGGFQLVDGLCPVGAFFTPGTELACFRDADDARARILHFLAAPGERQAIAAAGAVRAHAEHTYDQRLKEALARAARRDPRIPSG